MRTVVHLTVGLLIAFPTLLAAEEKGNRKELQFFEKRVRPLLAKHCYKCHGPKKQESELRLDTTVGLLKGGASGPVIEPGEPDQSVLVTAIRYEEDDLQMPPEEMLSEKEIDIFIKWIEQGAHMPKAGTTPSPKTVKKAATTFWAFQPPKLPTVPTVSQKSWPKNDMDFFVLARLEAMGLKPAPEVDGTTLIRRATLDLTGLPPTADEVRAFLQDRSPDAYRRVIDRLLASPAYGERWGRHWLDVVRYADSNGLDENIAHGNAWRYRDFVVSSINGDTLYGHFVRQQLAGDLLPSANRTQRYQNLIATGFLSLGPKVLAEVDEKKMEMDIVDEQVDTVGRAFMGITLGCARCHDHKFDPLTTMDYYSMAGIFKSTRTMEHFRKIARWNENPIPTAADESRLAQHKGRVDQLKKTIDTLVATANKSLQSQQQDGKLPKKPEAKYPAETKKQLKTLRDQLKKLEAAPPELPTAMGVREGAVADTRVHRRGSHLTLGPIAPRGVPKALAVASQPAIGPKSSGRGELANWIVSTKNPLTSRVMVNRVWRWHFGRGIVDSTDNFGRLGERPTHPQLLDWLAVKFSNGSLKDLHRLMMLSATYQMSSRHDAAGAAKDAENRFYWRFPLQRLSAESIRDSMLAVSGMLDRSMGGSMLHVKNRAFLFDHTSKDETKYDSLRRSLYLPVIRNHLYEVFTLFDYSDASVVNGSRNSTTVAPQALFMMNSDFVSDVAKELAALVLRLDASDKERLQFLYSRAYSRPATATEMGVSLKFLKQFSTLRRGNDQQAWAALCQAVLSSNEFIYIK